MSSTFKLNDPRQIAHNKDRLAFYAERARQACSAEKIDATDDVLEALAGIGVMYESVGAPDNDLLSHQMKRGVRLAYNQVTTDAEKIAYQLAKLSAAMATAIPSTHLDLAKALEDRGVTVEALNATMAAFHNAANELASGWQLKAKQGQVPTQRTASILQVWDVLDGLNVSMKAAGRVAALLLDGDSRRCESGFQAIRTFQERR
jgi:hypothetical protein